MATDRYTSAGSRSTTLLTTSPDAVFMVVNSITRSAVRLDIEKQERAVQHRVARASDSIRASMSDGFDCRVVLYMQQSEAEVWSFW